MHDLHETGMQDVQVSKWLARLINQVASVNHAALRHQAVVQHFQADSDVHGRGLVHTGLVFQRGRKVMRSAQSARHHARVPERNAVCVCWNIDR